MNGAELLVDVHMRQALVADLRQNPPVISVARPSNRPGTLRKGDEALSSGAAPQPQPQQLLLKSNDDEGNDHEDFFEDDVSSSARLSATASPHRGDGTNSEFGNHSQHRQTLTPHRSLGSNSCESPSPQSQRTRTAHPTADDDIMNRSALVVTRQQQHRTSSSGGDPPRASAAAGGVLSAPTHDLLPLPNTTARLLLRPASTSSSVNLFPVIPISETLKGLPRRLTFGSATTNRSNNGATGAPSSSTTTPPTMPSEAITKNTLALLTAPRHGVGSSSRRSNSLQMVRTKETLEQQHSQHLLQMPPPLPPASGRGSVCSDPDVEGDRGEHRGTASADGTARRVSSSSEQTTSQRFAGIGTSSMSGSLEKDLMITERIVKRIAEEYSEKKKKQQSLRSSSAAKQKKHQQQQQRSNNNDAVGETSAPSTSAKIHDSDEEDWDMFLSSVMSVSNTFQSISTAAGREPTINNAPTSSSSPFSWLNRRAALSAIHATRVPQEYWVTRDPIQQPRSTTDAAATAGNLMQALKDKVRVLAFPSTNPGNRPEVYLLARTLDQMIVDTVPDFKLLGDTTVAYAVLPAELSAGTCEDNATAIGQLYATVVRSFMQVVDVGLSEIARQIAGTCPERAALLDCMRQCCNDLHHTLLDVVEHSKRRAFEEAIRRQQYDDIISAKNRQIIDSLTKVTALEERVLTLETQLETNAMKAARFDELVSRMDLREQQRQRAIVRVDQLELLDDAEEAVSRAAMLAAAAYEDLGNAEAGTKPPESTMARIERLRQEEDERNHALLYTESVKLLKALRSSVEATDAACAPLYDRMLFSKPELNVSVASGRWASIGKALGEHEAVWDHRERVAKAHALWLEVMTTKANARLRVLPIGAVMSSAATADGVDAQQQQKTNSIREFECSVEQLRAMGIHDVTPDEIMMLQRDDFDSDHFLHPAQRIPARWGLKNAGVAQMLSDAEMTFSEITLRLEALKQSELLGDVAKPPMMPPSRPSDPCALCNRRDVVEIEKRQHKTFLDNLLRELGEREAEGQNEVKLAQEERDKAKSQLETQFEITQKLEERLAMLESQIAMQQRMGESRFDDEAVLSSLGSQQPLLEVSAASPRASAAGQQGVAAANVAANRQQTQAIAVGDVLSVDGGSMNVNNNGRSSTARSSSRTDGDSPLDGKGSTTRRNSHRSSSVLSLNSGSRSPPSAPLQRTMTSSRQRSPTEQHSPPAALEKRSNRVSPIENTSTSSPARSASSLVRKASTLVKTTSMLHKKKSTLKPNSSSLNASSSSGAPNHTLAAATAHNESVATEAFIPPTLLNSSIFLSSSLPDAPIVVQLVLNCACCGGGAGSTGAATPQHHLPLETNMLMMQDSQNVVASVVSVTDMSPPRRPATGERRKASNAGGDTVGGGAAPNATPGQQNQYQDGKDSSISMFAVDKGDLSLLVLDQPGAVGATPANDDDDDEGFIAVGSQLDSFVGAADPITTHSQTVALKRQASSRVGPVERASTRAALKSSSPSSAKELSRPGSTRVAQSAVEKNVSSRLSSAGSGPGSAAIPPTGEADPFGDHVAVVDDPVADGEDAHHYHRHAEGDGDGVESPTGGGGEFRDTGSFLIPRTGQETVAQSMWTQMEGQLLHRLKSSAIRASMSADVDHHTNPAASDITKIPKPPAGSDPRKSVGGGGGDRGLSAKQQRQSAGGGGRPSIHADEIARINSTKAINTIIDTNSTDDNLERGFKIANEKLRQNILKLSGRIESMQATSMRSSAWLLKYIGNFYRAKRLADATAENSGHAYIPAADFLLTFLKRKLGAKEVVFENMHNIYTTCRALKSSDLRIRQFMEVMFAYNNRQAAFFLQLSLALECCAVGLDYSVSHQHFALDEHATKPEVVCLRRIAAVLTETGLHKRPYAPFLWKALSHRSLAFEVDDDRFYDSLRKAGMEAEAIQRHPPSSWSEQDVSLMRVVVLKSAFLSLICGFETKLQSALLEPSSSSSALANIEAPHHPTDLLLIKVAEPSPSSSPHSPAA
ncbi:Hypothetical protein, putative [Bodo saltans]|uniref:Uncharacterized protein n=1 Tax=Bodo saltans TaxID=75058 RepID=A0A0S4IPG4_BODSA|nr:Hypothetical protein, putative [Bodo saltans]|eukprot:CUF00287.1 Hypothetical protein, putative [Bodo saltans]